MKTSRLPPSADGFVPAWPCSRRGLPGPSTLLQMPVVSYTTFSLLLPPPHPLSQWERGAGVRERPVSVALVRQVSSSRRVPRPGCYPTPCSMECGLSSIPTTQDRDRPTDLRRFHHTRKAQGRQPHFTDLWTGVRTKGSLPRISRILTEKSVQICINPWQERKCPNFRLNIGTSQFCNPADCTGDFAKNH